MDVVGKFVRGLSAFLFKTKAEEERTAMKISIERDLKNSDDLATEGLLYHDGLKFCFTLEPGRKDPKRPKGPVAPCIGKIFMMYSEHWKRMMPHASNQPDKRTLIDGKGVIWINVMLHPLNWPSQTEGCCGVGMQEEKDQLTNSDMAFNKLLPLIVAASATDGPGCDIEYVG